MFLKDIHLAPITDLQWRIKNSESLLFITSIDGYVTVVDLSDEFDPLLEQESIIIEFF